jgi:hypothetical protein
MLAPTITAVTQLPGAPTARRVARAGNYILAMMASPNSEHFSNVAPSISLSKS